LNTERQPSFKALEHHCRNQDSLQHQKTTGMAQLLRRLTNSATCGECEWPMAQVDCWPSHWPADRLTDSMSAENRTRSHSPHLLPVSIRRQSCTCSSGTKARWMDHI